MYSLQVADFQARSAPVQTPKGKFSTTVLRGGCGDSAGLCASAPRGWDSWGNIAFSFLTWKLA